MLTSSVVERVRFQAEGELTELRRTLKIQQASVEVLEADLALASGAEASPIRKALTEAQDALARTKARIGRQENLAAGLEEKLTAARADEAGRHYAAEAAARAAELHKIAKWLEEAVPLSERLAELIANVRKTGRINARYWPEGFKEFDVALAWLKRTAKEWAK